MADTDTSDTVHIQLRIGNKIYIANVTSNAVTEILMHGEKSNIVQYIRQGKHESVVIGQFKQVVEVMSVSQIEGQPEDRHSNQITEESMEIEVWYTASLS